MFDKLFGICYFLKIMMRRAKKSREFTVILDPEKYAEARARLEEKLNRRITHEEVARGVGISRAQLDYLRRGTSSPSAESMASLARFFGLGLDDLFKIANTPSRG